MSKGISLVELLIVLSIFIMLIAFGAFSLIVQVGKGQDAKRKDDLRKISLAFEDYFNDHGCYPNDDVLDNCGSSDFSPYLSHIPCDPVTKEPYVMFYSGSDSCHKWFAVFALLSYAKDPSIAQGECPWGCLIPDDSGESIYNWAVSSPNVKISDLLWDVSECGICESGDCCLQLSPAGDCNFTEECSGDSCYKGSSCNPNCRVDSCP